MKICIKVIFVKLVTTIKLRTCNFHFLLQLHGSAALSGESSVEGGVVLCRLGLSRLLASFHRLFFVHK